LGAGTAVQINGLPSDSLLAQFSPSRFGLQGETRTLERSFNLASYSIFTSGADRATAPNAAFPQEKPNFAAPSCSA
jgi:hypothetical protein